MSLNNNMLKTLSRITFPLSLLAFSVNAAVYTVEEVPTPEGFVNAFAEDINNNGQYVASIKGSDFNRSVSLIREQATGFSSHHSVNATTLYNHPIDVSKLDFEDEELINLLVNDSYDYLEDVKNGIFNSESLTAVLYYLFTSTTTSYTDQHRQLDGRYHMIGDRWAAVGEGTVLAHSPITDVVNENTGKYNFSHNETMYAINDLGWIVGATESPYTPFEYTDDEGVTFTYYLQDYIERGYVKINGNTTFLEPSFTEFRNGRSIATDISNSGYVVGYVSVDLTYANDGRIDDRLNACSDRDAEGVQPEQICRWQFREKGWNTGYNSSISNSETVYKTSTQEHHAYLWKLDESGNIVEARNLGIAYTPVDEDFDRTSYLYSKALAVNDNGVAVGQSYDDVNEDFYDYRRYAAIYIDGRVDIIANKDRGIQYSTANDINNAGYVVGNVNISYAVGDLDKAFYYNINGSETNVTQIPDVFANSDTSAKSINNENQVVGSTTVPELDGSIIRHGFVYDIDTDEFSNLNDLISCDSEYTIASAESINDQGVILATATRIGDYRNAVGEVVYGEDGESVKVSNTYVVKLTPIAGGTPENCFQEENQIKRKGSSMPWYLLVALPLIRVFRR
ncbi:DUF3466 family protein [Catenovulum sp. SM1970]|uniref:DUF3466 family protein n=1 Tax=Marinifaba aquimaris TaxID=2741323 RepID=UPI001571CE89|nr:DUF3466 family protein [Marinifaba aquimaris]NTS77354.1 DUF3466 family protein [Marinifaba aquimaris]